VRVIVMMFFSDPPDDAPEVVPPSAISVAVIGLTLLITFALGVFPQPLLDLAETAARFTI
jgi:NADH-quinone oxidoreductase subunit N